VFTIKVIIHSMAELAKQGDSYQALLRAIDNSTEEIKGYKDFDCMRRLLSKYQD
jgi:fatty acid-binding protein DegV